MRAPRAAAPELAHRIYRVACVWLQWPTGGWGSLEYSAMSVDDGSTNSDGGKSLTAGQVLGGRWRPLQYFYAQSVFAGVMATCGKGGLCYLKNDGLKGGAFRVEITEEPLHRGTSGKADGQPFTLDVDMPAGPGAMVRMCFHSWRFQSTSWLICAINCVRSTISSYLPASQWTLRTFTRVQLNFVRRQSTLRLYRATLVCTWPRRTSTSQKESTFQ
jgi:hypothetical protein